MLIGDHRGLVLQADRALPTSVVQCHRPLPRDHSNPTEGPIYGAERVGPDGQTIRDGHGRPVREFLGWNQPGKSRVCWDLTITCDGHRWYDRHCAGRAQTAKEHLEEGFRLGLDFDPQTKRFLQPDNAPEGAPTVFTETVSWWRAHWSAIEPKSRQETMRYISRPILELVRPGITAPAGLDAYLTWQLLPPKSADTPIPDEHTTAASWLRQASLPKDKPPRHRCQPPRPGRRPRLGPS